MSSERIKTQRKLLGWTQERMAIELGVSLRTYARQEAGKVSKRVMGHIDLLVEREINMLSRLSTSICQEYEAMQPGPEKLTPPEILPRQTESSTLHQSAC